MNPGLKKQFRKLVDGNLSVVRSKLDGKQIKISEIRKGEINSFLNSLKNHASPGLKKAIEKVIMDLEKGL